MLRGALAAAATPLRDGGDVLDEDAFGPYVEFLARGGLDGLLAFGTTGEGILLSVDERRRGAELFLQGPLPVVVHCGAQTTRDTVTLCEHAAESRATAVAVIGPPYFPLDARAMLEHFVTAAASCAPLPFYVYEFERTSGYAVPSSVLRALRERAPNLVGLKVSDAPYEKFEPYLHEELDVFVGPEAFIGRGIDAGAIGAVSALASAFPEQVAGAVRDRSDRLVDLRAVVERFPRHAALKHVIGRRGVPMREEVRRPLRPLTDEERRELDEAVESWLA